MYMCPADVALITYYSNIPNQSIYFASNDVF